MPMQFYVCCYLIFLPTCSMPIYSRQEFSYVPLRDLGNMQILCLVFFTQPWGKEEGARCRSS